MKRLFGRQLVIGLVVGAALGLLVATSMRGAGAEVPASDALTAFGMTLTAIVTVFTTGVTSLVTLVGQAVLAVVQAFATFRS